MSGLRDDITNLDPTMAAAAVRKSVVIKTVRNTLVVYTLPTCTCVANPVVGVSLSDGCGAAVVPNNITLSSSLSVYSRWAVVLKGTFQRALRFQNWVHGCVSHSVLMHS